MAISRVFLKKYLDPAIEQHYKNTHLTEKRKMDIEEFIFKLEEKLRDKLGLPSLKLKKFGSIINGFGRNDGDLDLCLVVGGDDTDYLCNRVCYSN